MPSRLSPQWLCGRVSLRVQSKYREIRTRNNSVFGHFSRSASFGVADFKGHNSECDLQQDIMLFDVSWLMYVKPGIVKLLSLPEILESR